ncbi:MAG: PAS domain S-box protein [Methanoregula sp.]
MTILLIEDNPADVEMIRELLSNHQGSSFDIVVADRLSAAKPFFADSGIDIILLDLGLPDSQGLDTLRKVREHASEVPIVVLTMLDNEETGLNALKEGAQDYLVKGQMNGPLIARSLRYAIERGRIEKELKRDLTERKQIEKTLKMSNERFRISALSISDVIWDWNILDGRLDWYGKTDAIHGYAPGEFPQTIDAWEKNIHPDDRDRVMAILDRHVRTQTPYAVEYRVVRKDGEIRTWTSRGTAMLNENGSAYRMVGSCSDITERKLAEEAHIASEIRYRRLFEAAQDGILILDADSGQIVDVNPFLINMLGFSREQFLGKKLWEIGLFKDIVANKDNFEELQRQEYIRYEDKPLETSDGRKIAVEFVSNVYTVDTKKVIQCNIRDITERKRAEDALTLASRKLGLLSGITRHDIVNQLTVLSGSLELALCNGINPKGIVHINRAQKAAGTIQDQIAFTKEYEDLGVMTPVWQRLSEIVRSAASQMAANTITLEIPNEPLEIYADPLLIKVFYNLFDNTRKYGGAVTRINISYHPTGTGLMVTVCDNGIGISSEDKKHLFERGFGKHTGLGLFLSREILSITGISISETSEPGTGAQFEIAVPVGAFRFTEEPVAP